MKILLNEWEDPRLSECKYVGKGDKVFANNGAVEYGFTKNQEYEILEVNICGYLKMRNDKGEIDEYTTEYFGKYHTA